MSAPGPIQNAGAGITRADWRTPKWLFEYFHERHDFKIDAAADAKSALCSEYFGLDNGRDALKMEWRPSRYWLNPPYGRDGGDMLYWIEYVIDQINKWPRLETQQHSALDAINGTGFLVPVAAGTRWWRMMAEHAGRTSLIGPSRVPFINPDTGLEVKGNPSDSSFAYISPMSIALKNGVIQCEDIPELVRRARKAKARKGK